MGPFLQGVAARAGRGQGTAEGALSPTVHVPCRGVEQFGPWTDPSGTLPITALAVDSEPLTTALSAAFQPVLYPLRYPSLKPTSLPLRDKDVMWDSVKLCIGLGSSIIEGY